MHMLLCMVSSVFIQQSTASFVSSLELTWCMMHHLAVQTHKQQDHVTAKLARNPIQGHRLKLHGMAVSHLCT